MRVLLDTHALVWAISRPGALAPRVREVLDDPTTETCVSAASAWEIATKVRIGRFDEARPLLRHYTDHLARLQVQSLDISSAQSLLAGSLEWTHRDPFDRMIAAQAISEQLVLVTADRVFRGLPALATLW